MLILDILLALNGVGGKVIGIKVPGNILSCVISFTSVHVCVYCSYEIIQRWAALPQNYSPSVHRVSVWTFRGAGK